MVLVLEVYTFVKVEGMGFLLSEYEMLIQAITLTLHFPLNLK